jgi:hypothetical protein
VSGRSPCQECHSATTEDTGPPLHARHEILREEIRRVCARRANLNGALAWAAARGTVDQAIADAPRAQATQGTLPHRPLRSGGQASGGTRTNGPAPAAWDIPLADTMSDTGSPS